MSAYKFKKEDFDKVEGFFVYATACDYHGTIATYELIDYENTVYKEIDLIDSGIGIAKENHKRIFDRFYRVSANENNHFGAGIGLYISQQIISNL